MNKDEILKASREENGKKDYARIEAENQAAKIGFMGILILVTFYYVFEIAVTGVTNYGLYSIIALGCAILYGWRAFKMHKRIDIVCGVIWGLMTALLVWQYITTMIATSTIM